jgi:hypothetical protein
MYRLSKVFGDTLMQTILTILSIWFASSIPVALVVGRVMARQSAVLDQLELEMQQQMTLRETVEVAAV